jgi:hypothetical protein
MIPVTYEFAVLKAFRTEASVTGTPLEFERGSVARLTACLSLRTPTPADGVTSANER